MKNSQKKLLRTLKARKITDFQLSVLRAAMKIPEGQTKSYKWLAEEIGRPKAYRAVGNALNKNPYPVLIPCHRIVHSNGSLGGYKSGQKHKKAILEKEKAGII